MNEPKKRGRPAKVKTDPVLVADATGGFIPLPGAVVREAPSVVHEWTTSVIPEDGPNIRDTVYPNPETHSGAKSAQAYAMRVWSGQSVDLPRHERIERVRKALEAQGLSMEGVEL